MVKRAPLIISVTLLVFLSLKAQAGSFMLTPIKVELIQQNRIREVKVINLSQEELHIQVEGCSWTQNEEGRPVFDEPVGLVFFPKIFKLEPRAEKIIRIGYRGRWPETEKAYRMFVRELPVKKPGETAIKVAMRISIPVFVVPSAKKTGLEIESVNVEDSSVVIKVKNRGNVHLIVKKFQLVGYDAEGKRVFEKETAGWYVLAKRTVPFRIKIGHKDCLKIDKLRLAVETKSTTSSITVNVTDRACKESEKQ